MFSLKSCVDCHAQNKKRKRTAAAKKKKSHDNSHRGGSSSEEGSSEDENSSPAAASEGDSNRSINRWDDPNFVAPRPINAACKNGSKCRSAQWGKLHTCTGCGKELSAEHYGVTVKRSRELEIGDRCAG